MENGVRVVGLVFGALLRFDSQNVFFNDAENFLKFRETFVELVLKKRKSKRNQKNTFFKLEKV